ncbi:MAG: hypothetical protein L0Z07_03295 [Planctomycetes bacterium]|nr:hypothetical protein [Planctomycetota bacterium]
MLERRTDRGESLLNAAISQLQDLPAYIDTDLRPPVVVLDSTKSGDGQDVLAVCMVHPDVPDGKINYLFANSGNSRFRTLGVKPGDTLKYYVLLDEESMATGIAQEVAMELTVAQILNENTLLVEGGLSQPVLEPAKIEVWRYVDDRLAEINRQLDRYVKRRPPPIGWEPSPADQVLSQIVVRLNQWLRQNEPKTDWQIDPLIETLDESLARDELLKPFISQEALAGPFFQPHEGRLMQEAVWLRDIASWAHGDSLDAVDRAAALFDWTVRNIQLDEDQLANSAPHRPWQTLLYGHGTAEERAWVFAQLCRHMGLDVVILAVAPPGTVPASSEATAKFWLPALVDDGQLYLFDARLGLAIPGPRGEGIATLEQTRADDTLLRQLDVDESSYPMTAERLKQVEALVVADPFSLTRRANQVDSKLAGDDKLLLSATPNELAGRLKTSTGSVTVRLWDFPFRTLRDQLKLGTSARRGEDRLREAIAFEPFAWRPKLWKARALHFQGRRQLARREDDKTGPQTEDELIDDHREAGQLYLDPSVRVPDRQMTPTEGKEKRRVDRAVKLGATYWVGLLAFDDGKYEVAADWLSRPELAAEDSPWVSGALYNLARTYETQGKIAEAVQLLEEDRSPQRHGNRFRAKWLKSKVKNQPPSSPSDSE